MGRKKAKKEYKFVEISELKEFYKGNDTMEPCEAISFATNIFECWSKVAEEAYEEYREEERRELKRRVLSREL